MRLSEFLFAAALAVAPTAFAQDASQTDPTKMQLARQLVTVSGGTKSAELMIRQAYSSTGQIYEGLVSEDKLRVIKSIQEHMQTELLKLVPVLVDQSTEIYARNLTEKELRDAIAWQSSESGRSISAKMPSLIQQSMQAEVPYIRALLPDLLRKATEIACDEAKCSPAQRQEIAEMMSRSLQKQPS